ncbi:pyruvate:ferredoxin (flavodoxin) oxidoreductase [Bythopirellula polymerisocia]|uniref:Pyruvate-flavodoxin oxidoreductase n=1 Tax=Bythopirellula polymerisocia TaxID=2528003 RepID=A0A5C6CXS1_9BACT|nr:pyruvate:ferredoxin (flavodoxin) oxidoreductase [Bythopirellula polymerisocia]TWU29753.1 Pyruvate-flavodoxin oxidoreductase [Bythopirellula polymerisocia]
MSNHRFSTVDGNEAAALIAHSTNEVIAIYPITPASPMGEYCDTWSSFGRRNIYGTVPEVIEMQSEAGAAGAVHGALQAGALSTTFTASQGLLLMIPNMFKIAGELTPTVFHVSARTVATHALSIFGDHSDVMAVRSTGWAMLAGNSVQEAHDFALISQSATFQSRVPFLHFFDGFRTSHEVNKIEIISDEHIRAMQDNRFVQEHRDRAMDPDRPVLRGSAQNPDVFFQAREACNPFYLAVPNIVQETMDRFAKLTGRQYHLFDYVGAEDANHVIVMMGSGAGAVEEAVQSLSAQGKKVGLLKVRLYRPFDRSAFLAALPATVERIAVLDRTKEPGSLGEPLYQDVLTAFYETQGSNGSVHRKLPRIIGGRYGLSSKEFTPAMVVSIYEELAKETPKQHFTVGIRDDVTNLSLSWDPESMQESEDVKRAVFYGLGSDGTVGASKNSVKIIGENTAMYAQGYFVYDSKKAGSVTVSHLRFSPRPINSTYLIEDANFVACHQFNFLEKMDVLQIAGPNATFLLNSPFKPEEVWSKLPSSVQRQIIDKGLKFHVIDALQVANETGMGGRINTVMQTCFFALADILPREQAIEQIKKAIRKTYGRRGEQVLERNFAAVDAALAALHEVQVPDMKIDDIPVELVLNGSSHSTFVERVTSALLAGRGELLPVSALPVDGTFPTGTAKLEKRSIATEIPIWDPSICIDCGLCSLVCPHAAIRVKVFAEDTIASAPNGYLSKAWRDKEQPEHLMTIQVAPDDCTGCGVCVDVCPAKSKEVARHKAINMESKDEHLERERANFDFFLEIEQSDRTQLKIDSVKGSQLLEPLFEFSGACAGCGETPYLKLMSQMFGDRALIGNATGCSSIYGGNLPTTPWTTNSQGRGPTWNNSLFEDNAEFGLGLRLAIDAKHEYANFLLAACADQLNPDLVTALSASHKTDEKELQEQRGRVVELRKQLANLDLPAAKTLSAIADVLVRRSVWIVGGDGWAYDIGFGGLDHVLTTGRDVNILVLDTGVYSNTGGQASKSTPRAAVAKFASSGKQSRRKDLGMLAVSYGNVYVAQIAMGANPAQTIRAFAEAESYPGPSLILAYSHCIAHGINMTTSMTHQKDAVQSAFWPLYRYDPREARADGQPFHLDSRAPRMTFRDFAMQEARFGMLARSNPEEADRLFKLTQQDINDQWHYYEQMAGIERTMSE